MSNGVLLNRLAGPLQISRQTRPRCEAFGLRAKIGHSAESPLLRSRLDGVRKLPVRSARTRRSTRSSRRGAAKNVVQGFRSGIDRNERAECRVDSVKHSTSPSRRENARRATTSPVFQSQSAATEHPLVRPLRRRVPSVCRLQHVHELRVPSRCIVGKHLIPLVRSALEM